MRKQVDLVGLHESPDGGLENGVGDVRALHHLRPREVLGLERGACRAGDGRLAASRGRVVACELGLDGVELCAAGGCETLQHAPAQVGVHREPFEHDRAIE